MSKSSGPLSSSSHPGRKKQDFVCRIKYKNPLPPQQFDAKSLIYPFPSDHLYKYRSTTLVESLPHSLVLPDSSLDLIKLKVFDINDLDKYNPPRLNLKTTKVDPRDEPLLTQPDKLISSGSVARQRPLVPWLRRTEYIGAETMRLGRERDDRIATTATASLAIRTREAQIRDIEVTFRKASERNLSTLRHPKKPHIKAVAMLPIVPDLSMWGSAYSLVNFDEDPVKFLPSKARNLDIRNNPQDNAIMVPVPDPDNPGQTIITYFLPTNASNEIIKKRKREEEVDEEPTHHLYVRSYTYQPFAFDKDKYDRLFFMLREEEGGAFYGPIRSRLELKRKRAKSKKDYFGRSRNLSSEQPSIKIPSMVRLQPRKSSKEEVLRKRNDLLDLGVSKAEAEMWAGVDELEDVLENEYVDGADAVKELGETIEDDDANINTRVSRNGIGDDEDEDGDYVMAEAGTSMEVGGF